MVAPRLRGARPDGDLNSRGPQQRVALPRDARVRVFHRARRRARSPASTTASAQGGVAPNASRAPASRRASRRAPRRRPQRARSARHAAVRPATSTPRPTTTPSLTIRAPTEGLGAAQTKRPPPQVERGVHPALVFVLALPARSWRGGFLGGLRELRRRGSAQVRPRVRRRSC